MPRHPPIALSSLSPNQNDQQQKIYLKMLASTIQFSNNNPNQTKHPHNTDTQQDQDNNETHNHTPHTKTACKEQPEISEPNNVHTQHHTHHNQRSTPTKMSSTNRPQLP